MTDAKEEPGGASATFFRSEGSQKAVAEEEFQDMDQMLLEMALKQSKHEEQQRKEVL